MGLQKRKDGVADATADLQNDALPGGGRLPFRGRRVGQRVGAQRNRRLRRHELRKLGEEPVPVFEKLVLVLLTTAAS